MSNLLEFLHNLFPELILIILLVQALSTNKRNIHVVELTNKLDEVLAIFAEGCDCEDCKDDKRG